jgi:uncharacterized protein YqeY
MAMLEQIQADLKTALRAGDEDRKTTLRMLLSAVHNAEIERHGPLDDPAVLDVVRRQAKQRRDAIAEFTKGGRMDLVAQEESELAILQAYLPPAPDDSQIEEAARRVIASVGASSPADMGKVMGPLMSELGAGADGQRASAIARRLLAA